MHRYIGAQTSLGNQDILPENIMCEKLKKNTEFLNGCPKKVTKFPNIAYLPENGQN